MRKIISAIIALCMATTSASLLGCGANSAGTEKGADAMRVGASEQTEQLMRVYFDTFDKQIKKGESFTINSLVTGGTAMYRALNEKIVAVSVANDVVTVTGKAAGTTYVIAEDAYGRQYNSCRVAVKKSDNEQPDPRPPVQPENPLENNRGMVYDTYNLDTYIYPYWRGNTVYNETALFVGDTDATTLMYPATKIVKVTSYDHSVTYEEGVDYTYDKTANLLRRTANSRMPAVARDDWYTGTPTAFPYREEPDKYLFFAEENVISNMQVSVTYEHTGSGTEWQLPASHETIFTKLHAKLNAKQNVSVLYYGDSVVFGANSSGLVNCGLHAPTYAQMISAYMREKYGVSVTEENAATGGACSYHAINYFPDYVTGLKNIGGVISPYQGAPVHSTPDLIVIGYGLNDESGGSTAEQYVESIDTLVHKARQKWMNCEILIVSPTIGNPEVGWYNGGKKDALFKDHDEFEQALLHWYDTTAKYYVGVAVAQVTTMHRQMYHKKGNRYRDITGNNINHPNDTGVRLIAQTCLHTLFGEEYYKK